MLNMIWMRCRSFTAIEQRIVFIIANVLQSCVRVGSVIWNSSETVWNVWECLHEDVLRHLTRISCCTTFIFSNSVCAESLQTKPTRPRWVYQELDPRVSPVPPTEDSQLRLSTGRSIHLRVRNVQRQQLQPDYWFIDTEKCENLWHEPSQGSKCQVGFQ